jgi:argininosuccinate lyase
MTVARSDATGRGDLDADVLEFTTSLPVDRALYAADIAGSLAHIRMLEECQIIPREDASAIRKGLRALFEDAAAEKISWPAEEDIHMAIEVELGKRAGSAADRLHTARSRNDQIALDGRLHLREQSAQILERIARFLEILVSKAEGPEGRFLMPVYTHR